MQDRVENYFLAWSNSVRRDLEALGVLESPSDDIDALLSIRPADMTDQQLETALALLMRYKAGWARDEAKPRCDQAIRVRRTDPQLRAGLRVVHGGARAPDGDCGRPHKHVGAPPHQKSGNPIAGRRARLGVRV